MDRPEFLADVPKVSKNCSIFHFLKFSVFLLVFELRRNRFKYNDPQGLPNADVVGSAHIQDNQASHCGVHAHGAFPNLL